MLPPRHRLPLRQVAPFYTFPFKYHHSKVSVFWQFVAGQSFAQAAVVISKKVSPTAVGRNRAKRIFRVLLSSLLPSLPPTVQLVIHIKKTDGLSDSLFHEELKKILVQRIRT